MPQFKVTVKTDGFRRAGRAWAGTTIITPDDYEEEAEFLALIKVLEEDPMFTVQEITDEADPIIKNLVEAISKLDPFFVEHYTQGKNKKPQIKALQELTGMKITAEQRDDAFELFQEKHDYSEFY